jgi:hypothetical protein
VIGFLEHLYVRVLYGLSFLVVSVFLINVGERTSFSICRNGCR